MPQKNWYMPCSVAAALYVGQMSGGGRRAQAAPAPDGTPPKRCIDMKTLWSGMLVALLGVGAWTGPAQAQSDDDRRPFELNVHAGTMALNLTDDHQIMAGGRASFTTASGWGVGGNYDWVNTDFASVTFYSGEVNLTVDTDFPADLVLSAGAGAVSVNPEEDPDDPDPQGSDSDFMVPLGMGLRYHDPESAASYVGYRFDIRDNIIFAGDDFDRDRHNWEFSAGVSLLF